MTNEDKVGCLVEEALKRKERLRNLKRKSEDNDHDKSDTSKLPAPKFRSYKPSSDTLKEKALEDAKPGDVDSEVKDQLQAATTKPVIEELDITNLAPRKPDWDLKRDIAKKLERLNKRTQKTMAEIIRERMLKEQDIKTLNKVQP